MEFSEETTENFQLSFECSPLKAYRHVTFSFFPLTFSYEVEVVSNSLIFSSLCSLCFDALMVGVVFSSMVTFTAAFYIKKKQYCLLLELVSNLTIVTFVFTHHIFLSSCDRCIQLHFQSRAKNYYVFSVLRMSIWSPSEPCSQHDEASLGKSLNLKFLPVPSEWCLKVCES